MIYVKALMALFSGASVVSKLITVGVVAVSLLSAYGFWHHKVYRSGYVRALSDIAAEDAGAINRASSMRQTWRACRERAGRWDQSEGRCL